MKVINIGRDSIFGNPFRPPASESLTGSTLPSYRQWLWAVMHGDPAARLKYYEVTGKHLPDSVEYKRRIAELYKMIQADLARPWCPGCKERTAEQGVCHGSILLAAGQWLVEQELHSKGELV